FCMHLIWKITLVDIDGLKNITKEVEENIQQLSFHSAYIEADLYYDMFQAYFTLGDYNKALTWLNKILFQEQFKKVGDIYSISRLLQLVTHWQLENTLLLDSLVHSVKREFMQKKKSLKFEKLFLKNFEKMLKQKDNSGIKKIASKWQGELKEIMHMPEERAVMNYFDFPEWLESVATGKNYTDIMKGYSNIQEE